MISVVGSINQDLVTFASRLPAPGETLTGEGFELFPGGKGANQAVAAARLGQPVSFVGCVGCDAFGNQMIANLSANGVETSSVVRLTQASTGVAVILVERDGENRIILNPGANGQFGPEQVDQGRPDIERSRVVLFQLEIPLATVAYAVEVANRAGAAVVLDPAPACPLPPSLLERVDVLTPNQTELARITGVDDDAEVTACIRSAHRLLDHGVKAVVVKMGERGCLLVEEHGTVLVPSFSVQAVDTTGAGDAFNGALAVAIVEGKPLPEACQFANAVGALAVTRRGAQSSTPTRAAVAEFLATHPAAEFVISRR